MQKIYLVLAVLLLSSCSSLRLTTIHYSYHQDRDKGYNELHNGLGFEYEFAENWHAGFIHYVNSQVGLSNGITLLREWPVSENWDLGLMIGIADGYKDIKRKGNKIVLEDRNQTLGGLVIQRIPFRIVIAPSVTAFGLVVEF